MRFGKMRRSRALVISVNWRSDVRSHSTKHDHWPLKIFMREIDTVTFRTMTLSSGTRPILYIYCVRAPSKILAFEGIRISFRNPKRNDTAGDCRSLNLPDGYLTLRSIRSYPDSISSAFARVPCSIEFPLRLCHFIITYRMIQYQLAN
jgi:hypothetical protein